MRISIDFGITVTDSLKRSSSGSIEHKMVLSNSEPSEDLVRSIFPELDFKKDIEHIAVTGGKHGNIGNHINEIPVEHINEVDAISEGAIHLSGIDKSKSSIIVNAGSGTACIFAKDGEYLHCSGTGVGGGTVLGLSKLLLNTIDPQEINKLASMGDPRKTDLILEDVVSGPIGQLPSDTTAVNFGRISKTNEVISREDLAAGIVNLVGQTAARIATSVALSFNATEIIVVGRAPAFVSLRKALEQAALITNFNPHFPKNGEYASALGAMLIAEK
jgi:type II pantothenate kinase|tara:strand:+ start:995 stop:1816 length:822 start_codon:yes stop_codon:yes gene_type:complete